MSGDEEVGGYSEGPVGKLGFGEEVRLFPWERGWACEKCHTVRRLLQEAGCWAEDM